jgi:patatin-like phospholipase/acyl hydrolase
LQVCFNSYNTSEAKIDFSDIGKAIEATTNVFKKYHLEDISEEFYKKIEQDVAKEVFKKIC